MSVESNVATAGLLCFPFEPFLRERNLQIDGARRPHERLDAHRPDQGKFGRLRFEVRGLLSRDQREQILLAEKFERFHT